MYNIIIYIYICMYPSNLNKNTPEPLAAIPMAPKRSCHRVTVSPAVARSPSLLHFHSLRLPI